MKIRKYFYGFVLYWVVLYLKEIWLAVNSQKTQKQVFAMYSDRDLLTKGPNTGELKLITGFKKIQFSEYFTI